VPGVELVTVLFVAYAFVFGVKRSVIAAIAFSLLRQLVFGFFPTVLVLYLVYFPLLAITFGALGKKLRLSLRALILLTVIACGCSACFTLLDNVITPLWYGYSARVAEIYFYASVSTKSISFLPQSDPLTGLALSASVVKSGCFLRQVIQRSPILVEKNPKGGFLLWKA
jgi:hypothetical protein